MKRILLPAFVLTISVVLLFAAQPDTLSLPNSSPLVTFRILFKTGSASDPAGKEGVAALTAAMLSRGGSREKTYDQIVEALFPMAASVAAQVDAEMTVFEGTTHQENLDAYYALMRSMLLDPGWREDDFRRLKDEAMNFLRIQLRSNNEEELGKEYLYLQIYKGHPYGHHSAGTLASLQALTLDDLKAFYKANYQRGNVLIGLAGGFPESFLKKVESDFTQQLSDGTPQPVALPEPQPASKLRVRIIQKETRATAISLGFPLGVTRSHPDWPALKVMQSYLGEHRSSKSYLYHRIREIRGMNYGDYAYIEYFPRGMFQFKPDPNLGRRQQIFQIWIRPVEPENGLFALRIALYELNKLVEKGMSAEDFESTRMFLGKQVNLLAQTQSEQLGYDLDSRYYGIPSFKKYFKDALAKLTLEDVNRAIRQHLRSTNLDVVMIAKDAGGLKKAIESGAASTVRYVTPPPQDVLDEDKAVRGYKLDVGSVEVVPVDTIFEK
jgi:zinc protease